MIAFFVYNTAPGLQIAAEYMDLFPGMIFLVITLYAVKNTHGVAFIGSCFFVGVSLAYLADILNTAGAFIPTWILNWGCTLQYLQAILIVLSTSVGVLFMRD